MSGFVVSGRIVAFVAWRLLRILHAFLWDVEPYFLRLFPVATTTCSVSTILKTGMCAFAGVFARR